MPKKDESQLAIFSDAASTDTSEYRDLLDSLKLEGCPNGLVTLIAGGHELNVMDEAEALLELVGDFSAKEICAAAGLTKQAFDTTIRALALPPSLQTAIREGKIKNGIARQLLKLSPPEWLKAEQVFKTSGALTGDDLKKLREVIRQSVVDALPDALFQEPEIPPEACGDESVDDGIRRLVKRWGRGEVAAALVRVPYDDDFLSPAARRWKQEQENMVHAIPSTAAA